MASPLTRGRRSRSCYARWHGTLYLGTNGTSQNIKAGFLCSADLSPKPEHEAAAQEATPSKPVHSVAPRGRDSAWDSGTDKPVDLWDSSSAPPTNSLIGDANDVLRSSALNAASATAPGGRPQPLLSFDDTVDGSFCSSGGAEDEPSSLVDVTGSDHMTLSYQHALQHAAGEGAELEDGDQLMTNGETFLKEGLQVSDISTLVTSPRPLRDLWMTSALCLFCRQVKDTLANHRRKNLANQRTRPPNQLQFFITNLQVSFLFHLFTRKT